MMCSIHKRIATRWLLAGAALAAAGCASHRQPTPPPLIIDAAMQKRDWNRSVAYYQNGSVPAFANRFHYTPTRYRPPGTGAVIEPAFFVGQTLLLPVTLVTEPLFAPVSYRGVPALPPTYTGIPASLPPASEASWGGGGSTGSSASR